MNERPIRYSELLRYLNKVKRSNSCPTCDHQGPWDFIVEPDEKDAQDPAMLEVHLPTSTSQGVIGTVGYVSIECPQCGHAEFISASRITRAIDGRKDGEQHE